MNLNNFVLACSLAVFSFAACNSNAQQSNLPVIEFEQKIAGEKVQLLDVRTAEEFAGGHLSNALQANWLNPDEFKSRIKALDKSIPVYTYCLSGARSAAATKWLNQNGYTAYNMQGGVKSWKAAGLPMQQQESVPQVSMAAFKSQVPADKTVLVDIGAKWCPPCRKMDPIIEDLVKTQGDKFVLLKVDGAAQAALAQALGAEEFPTFIIYKGGNAVWKKAGLLTKDEILAQL